MVTREQHRARTVWLQAMHYAAAPPPYTAFAHVPILETQDGGNGAGSVVWTEERWFARFGAQVEVRRIGRG